MTTLGPAERAVLLAFADDEHLMGQRHTEWIGVAPFLEEDLAFASIGQDELGHAAMLYELVISDLSGETPSAQAVDALAFRRDPADYRSCWLVEAPCTEWATALVRHWLYDTAEELRWRELGAIIRRSRARHRRPGDERGALSPPSCRRAARRPRRRFRRRRARRRRADRDAAARRRRCSTIRRVPRRRSATSSDGRWRPCVPEWQAAVDGRFGSRDWAAVEPVAQARRTVRSGSFATVYADMREVIMLDPDATW